MTDDKTDISRRGWLFSSIAGAVTGSLATSAVRAGLKDSPARQDPGPQPKTGCRILFQGDSITDCHRNRTRQGANDAGGFGRGYAFLVASSLLASHPKSGLQCFNRGISGHKVPDLLARWQEDCIDLKPDVVSILIGVNDMWHKLGGRYDGTVKDYEGEYTKLIEKTKSGLPGATIVVCEPFVLRCGAVNDGWFPEFDERRAAAKKVAAANACTWIPFHDILTRATKDVAPSFWAGDGVHPSMAGHALLAESWLKAVKLPG